MEKETKKIRSSILDYHYSEIKKYREIGVSLMAISKIINDKLPNKLTYRSYQIYCQKHKI